MPDVVDINGPGVDSALYCFVATASTTVVVELLANGKTQNVVSLTASSTAKSLEKLVVDASATWSDTYNGFKIISITGGTVFWNTGGSGDHSTGNGVTTAPTSTTSEALVQGARFGRIPGGYGETLGNTAQNVLAESQSVPGLYNPAGLRRFYQRLANVNQTHGGTGGSGVDVILLGDSLLFGLGATTTRHDVIHAKLRAMLQARYNPSGVIGGAGYVPFKCGGNSLTASNVPTWSAPGRIGRLATTTATGTNGTTTLTLGSTTGMVAGDILYFTTSAAYREILTVPTGTTVTVGTALTTTGGETVQVVAAEAVGTFTTAGVFNTSTRPAINRMGVAMTGATNQVRMFFDNTLALSARQKLTSLDLVYGTDNGTSLTGGTMTWDFNTSDAFVAAAGGTGPTAPTGTINCSAAQSGNNRQTAIGTTLTANTSYSLQVSGPAANYGLVEGVIAYYGDEACGIRVHNCSRVGMSSFDNYDTATLVATFDRWCARSSRATFGELFIVNILTNDLNLIQGTPATYTLANFKTNIGTLLDRAGVTNNSCVLYVLPPLSDSAYLSYTVTWDMIRTAVFEVAAARTSFVSILDLYELQGSPTTTTAFESAPTAWINTSAGRHYTDIGCNWVAQQIYRALTEARVA